MIVTLIYVLCMLWIPRTLRITGIQYIIQQKYQGVLLILFAKTLRWMILLNLLIFWYENWQTYFTIVCGLGLMYSMFKDKRYIIFDFQDFNKAVETAELAEQHAK